MNAMTVAEAYEILSSRLTAAYSVRFDVWNHRLTTDPAPDIEWHVWDSDRKLSFNAPTLAEAVEACVTSIQPPSTIAAVDTALAAMP